ncbi:MAG: hypothetical protein ACREGC_02680, partial [Minisyncoccia bacterium]
PETQAMKAQAEAQYKQEKIELEKQKLQMEMQEMQMRIEMQQKEIQMKELELISTLEGQKLSYMAETDRTRSDNAISHADNITKLIVSHAKETQANKAKERNNV